jgi:hypothetical protein
MEVGAVIQKTLLKSLWLVFVLVFPSFAVCSKVPAREEAQVTVSVHNDAGIPAGILLQAELDASRVFRQSGIEIRWLNCPLPAGGPENPAQCEAADFPQHLQLRIAKRSLNLNDFTMGISYLSADGRGCYADLFYERAEVLHESSHMSLASILGHGVAHEIGHLLLGTNSHAASGIMRARWQIRELTSASKGTLLFSDVQSRQMRNKLAAWHTQGRDVSHIATARLGD